MANLPAIQFEQVSKRFVFTADKPQSLLESAISVVTRRKTSMERPLWAVNDVSFTVKQGSSFALVGRNGSGKSTALKLAAGILRPTKGQVTIRGRISALLELGAGFHQDLTGRENIYLNGSVLGLSRADIDRCLDSIVSFSGLGDFIDMPVKHYSSGMYMRLGFSVAVHVEPDILIVDEILAVGDYAFQAKCLDKIREMQQQGTTIVMVSHHLHTIRNMCSQVVWMDKGQMRTAGKVSDVLAQYLDHFDTPTNAGNAQAKFRRWGTGEVTIQAVRLLDNAGNPIHAMSMGDSLTIEMVYSANQAIKAPEFGLAFFSNDGTHIAGPNNWLDNYPIEVIEGEGVVRYTIPSIPFLPGKYDLTVAIHDTQLPRAFDYHERAYRFQVLPVEGKLFQGVVTLPAVWEAETS